MIDEKLVVFFKESSNNGCNFYRIRQPALKMADRGHLLAAPSSELSSPEDLDTWFDQSDLIVTQNASDKLLQVMLNQKGKKRFVIDWDDNLFAVSPYNPAYRSYGFQNVRVTVNGEAKMLWEDGKNGFNITENKQRIAFFTECLAAADLVTTPSPILSGIFKKITKKVKVIKNFIDFNVWKPLALPKDDKIRIGWQGGWSHYEDWCLIKEALQYVLKSHPNVILVIMGTCFKGVTQDLPRDQVQVEDWVSIDAYPHKFKTLNLDIGIAPLANTPFNTSKSTVKWQEYSALKIPCVCSDVPPYSLSVRSGNNGLLANTTEEWIEALELLIRDESVRKELADNACGDVFENYDLDTQIVQYEDAYKVLCNMKKELIIN